MRGWRVMKIAPVLRTFPLPEVLMSAELGCEWQSAVLAALDEFEGGPTSILNLVHKRDCDAKPIIRIRHVYQAIHSEAIGAYGWDDLQGRLDHHLVEDGERYGLTDEERLNLLVRLTRLNHERHAAEIADAAPAKRKRVPSKARTTGDVRTNTEPTLFDSLFSEHPLGDDA